MPRRREEKRDCGNGSNDYHDRDVDSGGDNGSDGGDPMTHAEPLKTRSPAGFLVGRASVPSVTGGAGPFSGLSGLSPGYGAYATLSRRFSKNRGPDHPSPGNLEIWKSPGAAPLEERSSSLR
jgi:hypothetical protein